MICWPRLKSILCPGFISQGFPSLRLEAMTRLLTTWWSCRRTSRGFPLGMTVLPVNLSRPGRIIASWSGTAYSIRQAWLILQLTSISEGLSPICHSGTRLVGDCRPIQGKVSWRVAILGWNRFFRHEPFSRLSHTSDFKTGTPVATLPGAWSHRVATGTDWLGVSILRMDDLASLICSCYFSVAAHRIV